jgi:hypothetical protein
MAPALGPAAILAAQVAGGAALYAGLLALAGHRRLGEIARMVRGRRAAA